MFLTPINRVHGDYQPTYISGTGRNVNTRLTEHKRATKNGDANNHIAEHLLNTKRQIDWDSVTCITHSTNYYQRLILEVDLLTLNKATESWLTVTGTVQTTY